MEFKIFSGFLSDLSAKNKVLLTVFAIQAVLIVFLTAKCVDLAYKTRTIVVPTHLAAGFELEGDRASPGYVRIMAQHVTNLIYTYTPFSITDSYREFMAYVPPERSEEVNSQLQHRIDQISRLKIYESFLFRDFFMLKDGDCVISGRTFRWSAGEPLTTDDLYIRYKYKISQGGFGIEEISLLTSSEFNALKRNIGSGGSS